MASCGFGPRKLPARSGSRSTRYGTCQGHGPSDGGLRRRAADVDSTASCDLAVWPGALWRCGQARSKLGPGNRVVTGGGAPWNKALKLTAPSETERRSLAQCSRDSSEEGERPEEAWQALGSLRPCRTSTQLLTDRTVVARRLRAMPVRQQAPRHVAMPQRSGVTWQGLNAVDVSAMALNRWSTRSSRRDWAYRRAWPGALVNRLPANKGMNLAKRGQLRSFAGYPQCWAD